MIKATKDNAWILPCLAEQGITPSVDDKFFFKKDWHLQRAKESIAELMLGTKQAKETPLADIPTDEGQTIADLPEIVATAIAKPYGTLGLDSSERWGATTSPWFLFQHQAEDFIRGKISRCMMRKLNTTVERLELALGCFKWASISGVRDIPGFQDYFTTALILDKDATAEMNGETIDVEPLKTEAPIGNAVLAQILDEQKRMRKDLKRIDKNAKIAAAKTIDSLNAAKAGGDATARNRANATEIDPVRRTLERWIKDKLREWDRDHPERRQQGYKGHFSNAGAYREAEKHPSNLNLNGQPIFSAVQIKEWFKPSKIARRKRSAHK